MKLLICDDDISTVDLIQNQLDLRELGITRLLRAYNGEAAREIIESERPELVLCDIGMPRVNGIEVLKYVYDRKIPMEFAFLTCYESFEYARDAVRYGATNYLTKPLDLEELNDALLSMVAAARARKVKQAMESQNSDHEESKINDFLRSLRDGFYGSDPEQIQKTMDRAGIHLKADSEWYLVCISADMTVAANDGWKPDIMRYSFQYLVQEAVADRLGFAYMISDVGERFDNLMLFIESDRMTQEELETRCRRTACICNNHMGISPVLLISEKVVLSNLAVECLPLRKQIYKYRMQQGKVFLYRDTLGQEDEEPPELLEEGEILMLLRQKNKADFMQTVSKAAEHVTQSRENSDKLVAQLHHDLLQIFYGCLRDNHIQAHDLFQDNSFHEIDARAENSVFDMMNFASHLFDRSVEALQSVNDSSDMISSVKQYIGEHFRENIDRNEIAAVAFITPNYLSKRFHAETGMSLREYINELRIDEAKRLLLTTSSSVSEVACEVGFENISYFSTVFRKICGVSPVEWKNRKTEKEIVS